MPQAQDFVVKCVGSSEPPTPPPVPAAEANSDAQQEETMVANDEQPPPKEEEQKSVEASNNRIGDGAKPEPAPEKPVPQGEILERTDYQLEDYYDENPTTTNGNNYTSSSSSSLTADDQAFVDNIDSMLDQAANLDFGSLIIDADGLEFMDDDDNGSDNDDDPIADLDAMMNEADNLLSDIMAS